MEHIVLISAPEVLKIPIEDNGEVMVALSGHSEIIIDRRKKRLDKDYKVRKGVLEKLIEAHQYLPAGVNFLMIESYRPLSIQAGYFSEYSEELKTSHPEWDEKKIYSEASKYVAPPEIVPPHSTGGAIDLTLCDEKNKEIDMGTRLNADPEESHNACFTLAENISDKARANRKILIDALSKAGFVNYPTEWWHWSYGDRYWAYQTKSANAIYGEASEINHYLSYLMGADNIKDAELMSLVKIKEKKSDGDRMLIIPNEQLPQYIELIKAKLTNGFWNEIVGEKEILFIFKLKDGHAEEYKLSPETEKEIAALCNEFNGDAPEKTANVYKYISGNKFYIDFMIKHYADMINRKEKP